MRRTGMLIVAALTVAGACSKRQPPQQPEPQTQTPQRTETPTRSTTPDTVGEGARRAAAARAAEVAALRATLEEMVFFDYDESRIRTDAEQTLQRKIPLLRTNANVVLAITGHADERGSNEYNLALGLRRANAVRDFLSGFGIDASRINTDTMGEDRPLEMGTTEAAYARNRRAEFVVTRGAEDLRPAR